jgi:hypothetical protein
MTATSWTPQTALLEEFGGRPAPGAESSEGASGVAKPTLTAGVDPPLSPGAAAPTLSRVLHTGPRAGHRPKLGPGSWLNLAVSVRWRNAELPHPCVVTCRSSRALQTSARDLLPVLLPNLGGPVLRVLDHRNQVVMDQPQKQPATRSARPAVRVQPATGPGTPRTRSAPNPRPIAATPVSPRHCQAAF